MRSTAPLKTPPNNTTELRGVEGGVKRGGAQPPLSLFQLWKVNHSLHSLLDSAVVR